MSPFPRNAIVIGAARGIGRATAAALARSGAYVTLVDRCADDPRLPYRLATREDLDDAVAEVTPLGAGATGIVADACNEPAINDVVATIESERGGLDTVVVTAGAIAGGVPVWELPDEQLDALIDIDLRAVILAARVGVPALLRRPKPRSGRFIAVASSAATRGLPLLSAYCAAKAGVIGFTRALAAELSGTGVTANSVSPGSTNTAMLDESARLYNLESAGVFARQQPIDRLIDPAEVAAVIAFLAGPQADAITGTDYAVDGGLSI